MTATTQTDNQTLADNALANLFVSTPLINGSLLASVDGRVLAADLEGEDRQKSTAAILASSFALGSRLGDLTGVSEVDELVVKTKKGFVSIFAVGKTAALLVLSQPNSNLGLLNISARQTAEELAPVVANWDYSNE